MEIGAASVVTAADGYAPFVQAQPTQTSAETSRGAPHGGDAPAGMDDADIEEARPTDRGAAQDAKAPQDDLTAEERREVERLRERDMEVRAHEQAHVAAGGRYVTRAATYDYEIGPDGRRYAVGGEVQIDTSVVADDPAATIEKAQTIIRAAMAPSDPSPQDHRVAAEARAMEAAARQDMMRQQTAGASSATGREPTADQPVPSGVPSPASARQGAHQAELAQRFAGFFAAPTTGLVDHFA